MKRSSTPLNDQITSAETTTLLSYAKSCFLLDGDWVELGCYKGDTSVLLGKLLRQKPSAKLWIYDSFAGLPPKTIEDASSAGRNFQAGALTATKHEVVRKLQHAGLANVVVKKAWFDELTALDLPPKIAFAFLDGDLYASIKVSLDLVAPLMAERGIIIVHDYNNPELPGVARAVDEFLKNHPQIQLTIRHSLAIMV